MGEKDQRLFRAGGYWGMSISLDIAAVALLAILLISCISRKMTHDRSNRIFLVVVATALVSTAFDIVTVVLDNVHSDQILLLYVTNAGYLITHFLSVPLYLLFVISLTDTWHKLRKSILHQVFLILPLVVVLAAFIINLRIKSLLILSAYF